MGRLLYANLGVSQTELLLLRRQTQDCAKSCYVMFWQALHEISLALLCQTLQNINIIACCLSVAIRYKIPLWACYQVFSNIKCH